MTERFGFDAAIQKTERLYQSLLVERGHGI
jgi:hypothetical protein